MKAIRISLYVIAGLVVLLVLGVAVFAMTFNPNRYKPEIERLVKEKTGRTLSLKGDLQLAFWPALGAKVNGVTFSEHGSDQQFLAVDSAHASVALMPLLHGQAIVDGITVSGLKATVIKEKDGRFNFSDRQRVIHKTVSVFFRRVRLFLHRQRLPHPGDVSGVVALRGR